MVKFFGKGVHKNVELKAGDNGFTTTGKLMQWLWILTNSEASLKKHIYAAHVTEKIFKCNDCEF